MVFVLLGYTLPPREPSVDIVLVLINDGLKKIYVVLRHGGQILFAELAQHQIQFLGTAMPGMITQALAANFQVLCHEPSPFVPQHITYPSS